MSGRRNGINRWARASAAWMMLIACLMIAVAGCKSSGRIIYVPTHLAVEWLDKGEPAPDDGYFVPPALMLEVGPALSRSAAEPEEPEADEPGIALP